MDHYTWLTMGFYGSAVYSGFLCSFISRMKSAGFSIRTDKMKIPVDRGPAGVYDGRMHSKILGNKLL